MTNLQELINAANKLSFTLDQASNEEKRFCDDLCLRFEQLSWEMYRMANELKEIKDYAGV